MPEVFGPILTTGVALATAVVVIANPVNAPRADIQIPAVGLASGSGDAVDMLDENFPRAIAPEPESNGPFADLKDLVTALVARAPLLNAVHDWAVHDWADADLQSRRQRGGQEFLARAPRAATGSG